MSPWNRKEFRNKHCKALSLSQAKVAARVANETLSKTGNEKKAIIAGIKAGKNAK